VFEITPDGTLTTLHSFDGSPDGAAPQAGLLQASDGNFYGVTTIGGYGSGTVFRLSVTSGVALNASPTSISAGSILTATWSGIPSPAGSDWIGLYVPGAADTSYLTYAYTTGSANGTVPLAIPGDL